MKLFIQIPCFNEEKDIERTINSLPVSLNGIDKIEILIKGLGYRLSEEKLQFIDQVLNRYKPETDSPEFLDDNQYIDDDANADVPSESPLAMTKNSRTSRSDENSTERRDREMTSASEKSGVLPRSFMNTINRIKQEVNPKARDTEEQVLKRYRASRLNTASSIKFILLLIIVPLLIHQVAKSFLLVPVFEQYFQKHEQIVFINRDLEEEAFAELKTFKEFLPTYVYRVFIF